MSRHGLLRQGRGQSCRRRGATHQNQARRNNTGQQSVTAHRALHRRVRHCAGGDLRWPVAAKQNRKPPWPESNRGWEFELCKSKISKRSRKNTSRVAKKSQCGLACRRLHVIAGGRDLKKNLETAVKEQGLEVAVEVVASAAWAFAAGSIDWRGRFERQGKTF